MQKFPKVLRFYRKKDKGYYGFWGDSYLGEILPKYKLNWTLTEEQQYMAQRMAENDHWVIHMGTWRWKSWVIYNALCQKHTNTLILCHNIKCADDMYKWIIKNTNIPKDKVGLVHSKSKHPRTGIIDVMTHSSFVKHYKELTEQYGMILYDECDYNLSFPVRYDFDCMVGALIALSPKYLYGFTGTPYRAEGGEEVLLRIFWRIRTYNADESKYNFTPQITQILYKYNWPYDFENFAELQVSINDNEQRHKDQIKFINENKRKYNLILVKTVKESEEIHKDLPNSILMNGTLTKKEDDENIVLIDKAINGNTSITIVWTIDKVGRGVDIPPIDTLFLFSPVRFRWTVVQAVGRALRKFPGKSDVLVFDWCDVPLLKKQQQDRLKSYCQEYHLSKDDIKQTHFKS